MFLMIKNLWRHKKIELRFIKLRRDLLHTINNLQDIKSYGTLTGIPKELEKELDALITKGDMCMNRIDKVRTSYKTKDYKHLMPQINQALYELSEFNTTMEDIYPRLYQC